MDVVGTSEEMFHAVSRNTWEGVRVGRETTVVMRIVVGDTCSGEDGGWGRPRRCSMRYLVTPVRVKKASLRNGSDAVGCL